MIAGQVLTAEAQQVAVEFERNFAERGEIGAAFAAVQDGRTIVDLWGGFADAVDPRPRWQGDTLQLIFSGTKGLVAACLLILVERRLLVLDDPVCEYWPEFAAGGKGRISVAELVSHRARLPGIREPVTETDLTDGARMAELLAAQAPEPDPRAEFAYHALTYGWLCGELIRRVDGRSAGHFFAEEIARPLGLELWIGLPEEFERRVGRLAYGPDWGSHQPYDEADVTSDPVLAYVKRNPPVLTAGRMPWNSRAFHAAEIPAVNAIGTARSLARFYCCLACDGELDGIRLMEPETVRLGRQELSRFWDGFINEPMAYGVGFQLQTERMEFGPPPDAFGHTGAGGSVHAAWPDERLGVSYVPNQMRDPGPKGDPRSQRLLRELFRALRDSLK